MQESVSTWRSPSSCASFHLVCVLLLSSLHHQLHSHRSRHCERHHCSRQHWLLLQSSLFSSSLFSSFSSSLFSSFLSSLFSPGLNAATQLHDQPHQVHSLPCDGAQSKQCGERYVGGVWVFVWVPWRPDKHPKNPNVLFPAMFGLGSVPRHYF